MTLNTESRNAECRDYLNVKLSVIMLNVIVLNDVAPVFSEKHLDIGHKFVIKTFHLNIGTR